MNSQPKLSVVTITYNHEKYIREALDGFVMQKTNFPIEVIIADDASKDKTPQIIKEYAKKHTFIKPVLRKKNVGAVANFLDALKTSTGEYVAFCEGDDYWTNPAKLQTQVDFLEKHPKYVGCFHTVNVKYENDQEKSYVYPEVKDKSWYTTKELLQINYIPTNSIVYKRQNYEGLPANIMPLDWYVHLYHATFGKIAFLDKTMSVYRKHEAGMFWEYDRNRDEIWKRYGIEHLTFFMELTKLYKSDASSKSIIDANIFKLLSVYIDVDKKHNTDLIEHSFARFPELHEIFLQKQHEELQKKDIQIQALTSDLLRVGDERADLLYRIDISNKMLLEITNSRTWQLKTKLDTMIRSVSRRKEG